MHVTRVGKPMPVERLDFYHDDFLFKQGDDGEFAYLILEGKVQIEIGGTKVAEIGKNELVGEMSLINKQKRSAGVRAIDFVQCVKIDKETFEQLVEKSNPLVRSVLRQLAHRLNVNMEKRDK